MKQTETTCTTQIWRAAMYSTEPIESCVTPHLLRDYLNTAFIPDPILAVVLDRLIASKGRDFLMDDRYRKVVNGIMRRAERVFYQLRKSPLPIKMKGRASELMSILECAKRNVGKFMINQFQSIIKEPIPTDVIDLLITDREWDNILWLDTGKLINANRLDMAIFLLYISPWVPYNRTAYMNLMDDDQECCVHANIVMDAQKLSTFLSDHMYYDEEDTAYRNVKRTIEAYFYAMLPDAVLKPGLWKDVIQMIWRLFQAEVQPTSEFYSAVFVLARDVDRVKELYKKYHEIPNPRDKKTFLPAKEYQRVNCYSDVYLWMIKDDPENDEIMLSKITKIIAATAIADAVPIVTRDSDGSPVLWRARAFMDLVRDHNLDFIRSYPAAFIMILAGIDGCVPRNDWLSEMALVSAKDIMKIPTMDIGLESKKRLYGRLALFYVNNTSWKSLLSTVVIAYKIDIEEGEGE